jgi:hypothetical protein
LDEGFPILRRWIDHVERAGLPVLCTFRHRTGTIGANFFAANLLAGFSALLAVRIADRIGLVRTMVFTHLPSNVLLILLMPTFGTALFVLLACFSIS